MSRHIGCVSKPTTRLPPRAYWPDCLFDVYSENNVPCKPGYRLADNMGRAFRLVETSEAVTVGNMMTNLVTEVAIAATKFDVEPIGETTLLIDATVAANAYQNGWLLLTEGTGAGYSYLILEHTAGIAGTTDAIVKIEGGLLVATSATDTVGMFRNSAFYNVSQHNAANPCVEAPVGRCMATTDATNKYCWAQTWGDCLLKAGTGAVGAGDTIGLAEDDAGSVETLVTTENPAFVGISMQAIADGAWGQCSLRIYG